ncbi:hypothetical protein, partial [Kineococcus glutinatus]|uniref:hypothetical protein n=1 Tax=Kineococcus glutinatus TaxID=1070872 RepID=UPI0031EB42C5
MTGRAPAAGAAPGGAREEEPVRLLPGLSAVRVRAAGREVAAGVRAEHVVYVNTGPPYRLLETLDGTTRATRGTPGDVAVVPAGLELTARSADGSPQELRPLALLLAPALLEEVLAAAGVPAARRALVPAVGVRSPEVAQLGQLLAAALPDRSGIGALAAQSLGHALAVAVARAHTGAREPVPARPR